MYIDVNRFIDCDSDSDMIQRALDAARETGEVVVVPKMNKRTGNPVWNIDKTILLYDESTIILQNAHLRLADGAICNMFSNSNARGLALKKGGQQHHITIRGVGNAVLDGGVHNGLYEANKIARSVTAFPGRQPNENCMIYIQNVDRMLIENIHIKNQRYWAMALFKVTNSRIANIHFSSDSNVPNQDGVDLLKGCHDVIVENITGCTGDNLVTLSAIGVPMFETDGDPLRECDIYNITIRNIMGYGVGGCTLIRILNHDGFRIYNVKIDNVIETSPWSREDASVAPNPDLHILMDENAKPYHTRYLVPGEEGYRCEATIIIGEAYWYRYHPARPGDTYGISVSNVMSHARYALWINNTLQDSSFDNIRLFGNGFVAAFFGKGTAENIRFSNISYDKDCRPLPCDQEINIEWSKTHSKGFHCVYFNGAHVENVSFRGLCCAEGMDAVFGGFGTGSVDCTDVHHPAIPVLSTAEGVAIHKRIP